MAPREAGPRPSGRSPRSPGCTRRRCGRSVVACPGFWYRQPSTSCPLAASGRCERADDRSRSTVPSRRPCSNRTRSSTDHSDRLCRTLSPVCHRSNREARSRVGGCCEILLLGECRQRRIAVVARRYVHTTDHRSAGPRSITNATPPSLRRRRVLEGHQGVGTGKRQRGRGRAHDQDADAEEPRAGGAQRRRPADQESGLPAAAMPTMGMSSGESPWEPAKVRVAVGEDPAVGRDEPVAAGRPGRRPCHRSAC